MARGIEIRNGYVVMSGEGRKQYLPTTDPAYYGSMWASKVGSLTYIINKGIAPCFIFEDEADADDSDYLQIRPEHTKGGKVRATGTLWTGWSNLSPSGNGKGLFVVTGADAGVLAAGVPANCALSGNGSGVVIIADDNINKAVVMKYISATKKLTFKNEAGEVGEVTLS